MRGRVNYILSDGLNTIVGLGCLWRGIDISIAAKARVMEVNIAPSMLYISESWIRKF